MKIPRRRRERDPGSEKTPGRGGTFQFTPGRSGPPDIRCENVEKSGNSRIWVKTWFISWFPRRI